MFSVQHIALKPVSQTLISEHVEAGHKDDPDSSVLRLAIRMILTHLSGQATAGCTWGHSRSLSSASLGLSRLDRTGSSFVASLRVYGDTYL